MLLLSHVGYNIASRTWIMFVGGDYCDLPLALPQHVVVGCCGNHFSIEMHPSTDDETCRMRCLMVCVFMQFIDSFNCNPVHGHCCERGWGTGVGKVNCAQS